MKRINNLYDKIISLENLKQADIIARKGKKSFGINLHDKNKDANILKLHNDLKNNNYKTSKYDIFKIYEPKERFIYRLPYFPDRIMHHAIMLVLEPIWVQLFTADTYSCIKGRGIHSCANKLKENLKNDVKGTKYCLKIDVKKFYPSINHDILKQILAKKIKDQRLISLLSEIIDSAEGVPIGNYLSQYFANVYLAYFDHWIKETKKINYYYRYADDMVFLSNSKEELQKLFIEIQQYMAENLKLEIKANYQVFPVKDRGIDFVGYRFWHTHTLLRKSIKKAFARAVFKNKSDQSLNAYKGWSKHCNSINLINKFNNEIKQNASATTKS